MNLAGLDHVVLRCRDLEKMKVFYTALGCRLVKHNADAGIWHYSCGGSTLIDLIAVDGPLGAKKGAPPVPDQAHNVDHICIKVDPWVEANILAYLSNIGIKAEDTVTRFGADGNGPSIYIEDPEGTGIELKGRLWPIDEA